MHRADLVDSLVSRLPKESVYFGKHLSSYEQRPGGGVKLHFKDGSTAEADVLVAGDGIKSTYGASPAVFHIMVSTSNSVLGPLGFGESCTATKPT